MGCWDEKDSRCTPAHSKNASRGKETGASWLSSVIPPRTESWKSGYCGVSVYMCECVWVHLCECESVCESVSLGVWMYVCVSVLSVSEWIWVCVFVCLCVWVCFWVWVWMLSAFVCTCVFECQFLCQCARVSVNEIFGDSLCVGVCRCGSMCRCV